MLDRDPAKDVRNLASAGELLAAVDLAREEAANARTLEERHAIRIEEIVALARMASLEEAQEKFAEYELAEALDSRARSLVARFKKDLAFAAIDPAEVKRLLTESRDLYLGIARPYDPDGATPNREQYEYNGINALTLSAMLGDLETVADVAEKLGRSAPEETYWSWATRAEYLAATGAAEEEVSEALRRAVAHAPRELGWHATTLRQLARLAPGHPALDIVTPGPILHFSGHMIAAPGAEGRILAVNEGELTRRIEAALDRLNPSAVYGSLASGADLIIVEWALKNERDARVFLPFGREAFIRESVAPAGEGWVRRAKRCLRDPVCKVVTLTDDEPIEGDAEAFRAVSRVAMGGAILRAEHTGAEAHQLLVWDGEVTGGVAGASADREMWLATDHEQTVVDVADLGAKAASRDAEDASIERRPRSIVFGDVKNFSKLRETQLPAFVSTVMGAVKHALDAAATRYGADRVRFTNTWGDGVFAVFETAAPAAFFALDLQDRMAALKPELAALGLPSDLSIRLGLHHGVVYRMREPVTGVENFFGEAVARAARIEPVTKAGRIFVSEEFAAELALDPESPAISEYVGEVDTAKKYGRFRLYRIRKR